VLVVAVGGVDPTGGAGVVRDLLTARTWGARVRLVPTAWTEQSASGGVSSIEPRDPAALGRALEAALAEARAAAATEQIPAAVKIGMLADATAVGAVVEALSSFDGPVVLDPVLGATSGGALFQDLPEALMPLARRATLVTPNAPEAAALTGHAVVDLEDAERAARELVHQGARAVLVKGGHLLTGDTAVDVLVTAAGSSRRFAASRVTGPAVRGTGCALATAIAVGLGRGLALADAVIEGKRWLRDALTRAVAVGPDWHID
jgi:hydroxymethylpyrimidine kinase/phosphomethylpyrimidine kinase